MPTYRAQIIWDFEFDEDGYTKSEREYLEEDLYEGETLTPRTPEQMAEYAKSELYEYLSDYRNKFYDSISIEQVKE